ncbi:hypothetical protein DFH11DRAFT_1596751 [Phellopilus nigrolimitatus]|nr:hypothetical protein DFH11DRAFT_1596751 [Phellopilus nigrolimitatus]
MADVEDAIKLIPRAYQEEILARARRANVIATLDTGSGKTFIAALLIKWTMALPTSNGKKTIFLVPKVPLVDQQRDFLAAQTPLTVRGYKGAMGVDEWDRNKWQTEFAQADCFVMTGIPHSANMISRVVIQSCPSSDFQERAHARLLEHGSSLSRFNVVLLVFDECHHAQQQHPYNTIMTDHYFICQDKPRVIPVKSITTLQRNLSANILSVRDHAEELNHHSHKPVEVILKYSSPLGCYLTYHNPSLWEHLQLSELLDIPGLGIKALKVRYDVTFSAVGPAGADYFLFSNATDMVKELSRHDYERSLKISLGTLGSSQAEEILEETDQQNSEKQAAVKLEKLRSVLSTFEACLSSDIDPLPMDWLSPKLRAAINTLVKYRTETFQGIIFVDQRQVATALSWVLRRVATTKDWIRCYELMGHGDGGATSDTLKGMTLKEQNDVVRAFRSGELNLLIATSVAEEGLDFPACELVIRYDSIRHMVGYVQSRGRARQQKSTYVVMIDENDATNLTRYEGFRNTEPDLKKVYQTANIPSTTNTSNNEQEPEQDDPRDLAERENYVIPSTGATLTYNSAIALLDHLCALIPRDRYTSSLQPKYTDMKDKCASVQLPRALPLANDQLVYHGPQKHSKKEAKRAVAFSAVRALHGLGVFDDYLSPVKPKKGDVIEDADGRPIAKVSAVAKMMDVFVAIPWKAGPPWYLHAVQLDDRTCAGLVAGCVLPEVSIVVRGTQVRLRYDGHPAQMATDPAHFNIDLLEQFTKMGLWWCVTASPIASPLACFLVPLDTAGAIDWEAMRRAVADERGTYDWSAVSERDEGRLVLMNAKKFARPLLLERFRLDLSLDAKPEFVTENTHTTYAEYFEHMYPPYHSKNSDEVEVPKPPGGPILEVSSMARYPFASYERRNITVQKDVEAPSSSTFLLPQSYCRCTALPYEAVQTFQVFAPLCQRVCDVFRARACQKALNFPPIPDELMVEALTLPCTMAGFSNQRLETMGDSVLKLSVIVYVYNHFPHKHEGQLSVLKQNSISNRLLLDRARQVGLERFLSGENRHKRTWQCVLPPPEDAGACEVGTEKVQLVRRQFPRRSLQDCMEASLGASYIAGGVDLALRNGNALGLCFGGPLPWPERYPTPDGRPPAALFKALQEDLQYKFRNGDLLVEAVKHASFDSLEGTCYQRLEFLGDAVIELVVTTYLYNKFPEANSGKLTWARARAICNATISALAVKRLSLHKYLLANNVELSKEIAREVVFLGAASYEDVAINDWRYDPPKVLGDVFESVMGAIFVDSGFNYPFVAPIIEKLMEEVLEILHPDIPRDPVTRLLEWVAKAGCVKARFRRVQSNPDVDRKDSVVVLVHDRVVAGPIFAANRPLAKGLASEEAKAVLSDATSELALHRICDCMRAEEEEAAPDLPPRDVRERDLDTETEAGFALAGRVRLEEVARDEGGEVPEVFDDDLDKLERQEVEMLLCTPASVVSEIEMDCS